MEEGSPQDGLKMADQRSYSFQNSLFFLTVSIKFLGLSSSLQASVWHQFHCVKRATNVGRVLQVIFLMRKNVDNRHPSFSAYGIFQIMVQGTRTQWHTYKEIKVGVQGCQSVWDLRSKQGELWRTLFIHLYTNSLQGLIYHLHMQKLRHLPTKRRNARKQAGMMQKRFVVLKRHRLEFKFCHGGGV